MTGDKVTPAIVVGVRDGEHAAMSYALSRAEQLGCDVRVVHAYHVPQSAVGSVYALDVAAGFEAGGNQVLAEARRYVQSLHQAVKVHYVLTSGLASAVLVEESADACEIVIGPDNSSWVSRLFEGEVCRFVVTGTKCPVVVVPERSAPLAARQEIVLTAGDEPPAEGPLGYAFEMASASKKPLRILHVAPDRTTEVENDLLSVSMSDLLERWRQRYDDVKVDLTIVCGDPPSEVRRRSESAAMVVVGRSHVSHVPHLFERPFAEKLIVRASCPIAVVPPSWTRNGM